jgi:hypothetical protein
LGSTEPTEFLFDFTNDPIPAGVTDLYLHVVFEGTLGNEADIAIAVGMKDLNEPAHVTFWNSSDEIAASENELVPNPFAADRDFIIAFTGEDPDPDDDGLTDFGFYDAYSPLVVVERLEPAKHFKIIVLLDNTENKYMAIDRGGRRCMFPWSFYEFSGVEYQEDENGVFQPTQLLPYPDGVHRGVRQHHYYYRADCPNQIPSCPYLEDQRSVPEDLTPYPLDGNINFPAEVYNYDPPVCADW